MSEISFPVKDLTRRKFQTGLTILGLTICTSSTVFLVIFGSNLGFDIAFLTVGGQLTSGFSNIFFRYILIVGILNIVTGAVVTSFLVYLTMSERVRDIGVMKASGCLSSSILGYFLTELSILVFSSCAAGTVFGIGMHFLSINLLNALGFSVSQTLSPWTVLLILLVLIIVSHIIGALPILKVAKVKPVDAFSPIFSLGASFQVGKALHPKLGLTFKIAYRSLIRRRSATSQAIFCLAVVLSLTTVTIAGGMIANRTTKYYVERAIGEHVLLVGNPILTRRYVGLLSQFFEAKEMNSVDYNDPSYLISDSLIHELSSLSGVRKADPRYVLEASVQEIPGIIPHPDDPDKTVIIGDSRSDTVLILGVEPEQVVNEWLVMGKRLEVSDHKATIIGDSLALKMFGDPLIQSIKIFEETFEIVGVCLDPLNNGKVVYLSLNDLSGTFGQPGHNLLFLGIEAHNRLKVLTEIENVLSGENMEVVELNDILDKHVVFLDHIWSSLMFLPLFTMITATLCLLSYLMLSVAGQQSELGIMRALGAKPNRIMKIILTQALFVTLASGVIGISVGLVITFTFLIPESVITIYTLISVVGWLFLALGILCLSSLYPAWKAVKKSVVNAIHSV